jgi:hypothetical protein
MRDVYKILVSKPEGKSLVGRPEHRWDGNIKVGHKEIGFKDVDWMLLVQ